jgi:hypothetical protein
VHKLQTRSIVVLIALGIGLAGCGHAKPHTDHAVRTTVVAGKAVSLTNVELGVEVTADPDVLPPGTLTASRPASAPPVAPGTAAPVDVTIDRAEDLRGVVRIRFKLPPDGRRRRSWRTGMRPSTSGSRCRAGGTAMNWSSTRPT